MENDLAHVVDALPGLVSTALPDGNVDFVNRRWCEYTGLRAHEAYGCGWQSAVHPDDVPELLERWQGSLASGESLEMEARLRRFDGMYRWFLFRTSPLLEASGRVIKWCGMNIDIGDRKQVEEALPASWWLSSLAREHHFRTVGDSIPVLGTLVTTTGEVELVNRNVREYLGATAEELKGRAFDERYHPDDLPDVHAVWTAATQTGMPYDVEARLLRTDGVYRWFSTRGFPLRDADGRIVLWYVLQTDIDDRRRTQALLAGERRLLEMVAARHSMSGIMEALCRHVESTANGSYCSIVLVDPSGRHFGHGAAPSLPPSFIASVIGRCMNVHSDPCAMAVCLNQPVIASDLAMETRWDAKGWRQMALEHGMRACWSTPISSAAGRVLGAFAIYYDAPRAPTPQHQILIDKLTHIASIAIERAQSDAALKRSEEFLAQAQHVSSTGGFSWRVATDEILWSEEAYRIFELDPAVPVTLELIGTRLHPEDMPAFQEMLLRQRNADSDFEENYRLLMPSGSVKYLHMVAHATRDEDGQRVYIAALQDVTQRRLSEEALGRLRSELAHMARVTSLSALTASIAHEVNQPLSGIITNASTCLRMLAADPPNVDGARETARRTIRDGHRAADVITRLRALFSKQGTTTELIDLNEAAREVIALSLSELQRNRVILCTEMPVDLRPVRGDRVQLQQVILNLLLNASDAMSAVDDRPRQLVIRTEQDGCDSVRVTVRDVGTGLDAQNVERVFDPFYTTKTAGMGMGLAVSRSIIDSHQGRLWATPNDGPGATFSFSIPRETQSMAGNSDAPASVQVEHAMRGA